MDNILNFPRKEKKSTLSFNDISLLKQEIIVIETENTLFSLGKKKEDLNAYRENLERLKEIRQIVANAIKTFTGKDLTEEDLRDSIEMSDSILEEITDQHKGESI